MEPLLTSISDCRKFASALDALSAKEQTSLLRWHLCNDLYFLVWYGLGRADIEKQWLFDRCREVQADPNDRLDLWAREHYKSTIITLGLTLQELLANPELTFGIFSHTRPIAKGFLRQIKRELEANALLKRVFPDIIWEDPSKQAPKWSEDDGLILKRTSNPKESSIEAWGLVDGQPTSKHFARLVYDDVVTVDSVGTPDMIQKTTERLQLSYSLGAEGGQRRFIGTRYHHNDTYRQVIDSGTAKPRIYRATLNGEADGEPVLMTKERLAAKRRDMGPYIFSAQMMQDPTSDKTQGFKREWLRFYSSTPEEAGGGCNKYILVDAANEKRKENDYTSMWCVGLGSDANFYVLDILRDRLNLAERTRALFKMHKKWRPLGVRYEKYGLMADTQHIRAEQERVNYRFEMDEVGGQTPKGDRIKRLIPSFEQGKWYFPVQLHYTDYEKLLRDMVHVFIEEEYAAFPVGLHPDMLDSLARIAEPDLPLVWPQGPEEKEDRYGRRERAEHSPWAA